MTGRRLDHLSRDGLALAADHPFWKTHYPPNGWGSGCHVLGARSERGARRVGGDPSKALPPGWDRADPKTGAPPGIGKGWGHAPGDTVSGLVSALAGKLPSMPAETAIGMIQSWIRLRTFEEWYKQPRGEWPLVRVPDTDAEEIGAKTTIAVLSAETAMKQRRNHADLTPIDYATAQIAVDMAQDRSVERNPITGTRSLIYIWQEPAEQGGGYVIVVKATISGSGLFVTSFRRLSRQAASRDAEVARLLARTSRRSP